MADGTARRFTFVVEAKSVITFPSGGQRQPRPGIYTRFRFPWRWDGREAVLQSRCTDETGYVQPTRAELVRVWGLNSVFHNNAIQSWRVAADGTVHNVYA